MNLPQGTLLQGGKYRIEKILGQGGFGITYLATQVGLNRKVAIKEFFMKEYCNRDEATSHVSVPSVGSVDLVAKFRQKFIKEAQTIAEMENPHIVHIYDVFEDNGTAYYAMQFIDGGCLNDVTPLSINDAVLYIKQIADALGYCHKRKILHLDVKPANILFKDNNAVLIDFGISKHYDDQGGQTSSTPVGISKGYAPLEQYNRSDMSSFTPSTDIYSLGATLYKLIMGQTPPDANYVHENGIELPDHIPANIRNAITKAMEPRRKDRPQSIAEFLEILDGKCTGSQGLKGAGSQSADDEETIIDVDTDTNSDTGKRTQITASSPKETAAPKTPEAPKKKKSKAWIFILLAIILGGAGYYFVNEKIQETKRLEAERIEQEQEAAREAEQLAQAKKEAEAKAQAEAEKKKKEEEARLKAEQEASYSKMIEDKEKYLSLISEGDRMSSDKKYSESIIKYELAQVYEEKYAGTDYSSHFSKGASSKISSANNLLKEQKAEQARLEKERQEREVAAAAERKRQEEYARTHGTVNGYEWVDLGLSVKWATCNVGANKPEAYGNYYAWGETSTKSDYSSSNSVTYGKSFSDIKGDSRYDAARANWGGSWRLPTKKEYEELKNKCTWKWTTQNGVNGYRVTGPNGNSIFLPAAGCRYGSSLNYAGSYGDYWSSTPSESNSGGACYLSFDSGGHGVNWDYRYSGRSVRPVTE